MLVASARMRTPHRGRATAFGVRHWWLQDTVSDTALMSCKVRDPEGRFRNGHNALQLFQAPAGRLTGWQWQCTSRALLLPASASTYNNHNPQQWKTTTSTIPEQSQTLCSTRSEPEEMQPQPFSHAAAVLASRPCRTLPVPRRSLRHVQLVSTNSWEPAARKSKRGKPSIYSRQALSIANDDQQAGA